VNPSLALVRDVAIVNELGLHARSAARIARIAAGARSGVWLIRGAERADATSILEMLTLGCSQGTTVTLAIEDAADRVTLEALVRLFEAGFEEQRP
jgi:phosphocarrier protein